MDKGYTETTEFIYKTVIRSERDGVLTKTVSHVFRKPDTDIVYGFDNEMLACSETYWWDRITSFRIKAA